MTSAARSTVIDYRTGRAAFVANYQVILGDEFRRFDPNQGNYILSGSASVRTSEVEIHGVFYINRGTWRSCEPRGVRGT